jgi:site-specific recombinase XerD
MNVVAIPRFYNKQTGREVEAFNLFVRGRNKGNKIYYVKLRDRNGNIVSGHYTTHRADYDEARLWAVANYDRLLNEYHESLKYKNGKTGKVLHHTLTNYFNQGSAYLKLDKQFGIERSDQRNKDYASLINRIVIPYLSKNHLYHYNDLSVVELNKFQIYCVNNNISNKNITEIFYALKIIFNRLVMEGIVGHNAINDIVLVKRNKSKEKGIFSFEEIEGLFNDDWEGDEDEYMIHLIAATTGLRNSEIRLLKTDDIETINGVKFLKVNGTKTENAIRKAPVHNFVYGKIRDYIKKHNRQDYIFLRNDERVYTAAEITNMIQIIGEKIGLSYNRLV